MEVCLFSKACRRALVHSVPVRHINHILSLGPQRRHQQYGLGAYSLACTWSEGIARHPFVPDLIFMLSALPTAGTQVCVL